MTNKKMNVSILIIYLSVLVGISIVQVSIQEFLPKSVDTDAEVNFLNTLINLLTYGFLFFTFVFLYRNYFKKYIKISLDKKWEIFLYAVIGALLIMAMSYISSAVMNIFGEIKIPENQETLNNLVDGSLFDKIALVLFAVGFAPLVEEMVFRKAIYGFMSKINPVVAIVGSGLIFGYIHVLNDDIIQIMYYALLGMVLSYIYFLSNKNIIVPIIVHALFNLFVVVTMFAM